VTGVHDTTEGAPASANGTADHSEARARAQIAAQQMHAATAPPPPAGPVYIGLVTRAVAIVVDAAVINLVAAVVAASAALVISVFPLGHSAHTALVAVGGFIFVAWLVGYFATFWVTTGQTPGNRVMHIRVQRADGGLLRPVRALLRVGGLFLAALPLFAGFVPILFNARRRGLPDWIADTVVVAGR
jgi:uncharacterized RDD family membrane protein YckC